MSKIVNAHDLPLGTTLLDVAVITETGGERHETHLRYRLYDTEFHHQWGQLIQQVDEKNRRPLYGGDFYGPRLFTREQLVEVFKKSMARIVQERPYKFAAEPHLDLSQNELNALHEDFEFLKNEFVAENSYGQEYREAVDQINLSVHRFEALNDPVDSSHIQVLYDPTTRVPFTDQGYSLFQTTRAFGHLYLTYGLTGVPVISAYHSRATGKPRLQDVYTEGFIMYFGETDEFGEWENLEKYIKENYDLDANDPKVTIGFVPLGVLETEFTDTAEIHQFLSTAKEIGRVSCK